MKVAIKVLRDGQSHHGGSHAWSIPMQRADGSWKPGAWTPAREPTMTAQGHTGHHPPRGWHLTRDPVAWWSRDPGVVAYLAEYRGRCVEHGDKVAVEKCRLLRPLSDAELEAHGIYLSGKHQEVTNARIIGGVARIASLRDCSVVEMHGSARVDEMHGSARVDVMYGSARVDEMRDSSRVGVMRDSSRVGVMRDSSRVDEMHDSSRVGEMHDSSRVDEMRGPSRVDVMHDCSIVVVQEGAPTVSLRDRASVLDYRPSRPVHHVADEGKILTLWPDGTATQQSEGSDL